MFLMLTATGLALITVFTFAARLWWAFDLFSHFRLQYVLAALVLGIVALSVRAYGSAAVLAAVALVHGAVLKDLWLGGTASAAPGGVPLRLVSANVLAHNRTPEKVLEFVRAADPDLVLLVDIRGRDWREVLGQLRELYPHHAQQAWRARARVVLLSRWPIVFEQVREAPRSSRPYLVAKLAVEGRTLDVVGVHPSSPSPSQPGNTRRRNHELDHIAEVVKDTDAAVIVAGDFNTTPWSPQFGDLLAAAGLRNAAEGKGYVPTWPTFFWPARIPIDHVLLKVRSWRRACAAARRSARITIRSSPTCACFRPPEAHLDQQHAPASLGVPAAQTGPVATRAGPASRGEAPFRCRDASPPPPR